MFFGHLHKRKTRGFDQTNKIIPVIYTLKQIIFSFSDDPTMRRMYAHQQKQVPSLF